MIVWNDLQESGQIRDLCRVEPTFHIHQTWVRDTIEISAELFALGLVLASGAQALLDFTRRGGKVTTNEKLIN